MAMTSSCLLMNLITLAVPWNDVRFDVFPQHVRPFLQLCFSLFSVSYNIIFSILVLSGFQILKSSTMVKLLQNVWKEKADYLSIYIP